MPDSTNLRIHRLAAMCCPRMPAVVDHHKTDLLRQHLLDINNVQGVRHRPVVIVLAMMRDASKAGQESTTKYWLLKALAQQIDLSIHFESEDKVVQADRALLRGEMVASCAL